MAALCCDDVLQIIDSSEWEASDDEGWDSANEEEEAAQITPLDREQFDADDNEILDNESYVDDADSSSSLFSSTPASPLTPQSLPSSRSPQTLQSQSSTSGSSFNPLPFVESVGPTSKLDSMATPLDFLLLLFDEDIFQVIVDETNRYALQPPPGKRYKWYNTCIDEIKLFLGIIIAMGLHKLPRLEDYWSSDSLLGVPSIIDGMPIDRFKVLLRNLHLNDNEKMKKRDDPNYDKLHKLSFTITSED